MIRPVMAPLSILLLAAALCGGGCLSDASRKRVADSGSILAIIGPPTPAEAAAMMADPFDADRRYKGVTWISNAPWGGADVYVRVYRELLANDKEDPGVRAVAARALAMHGNAGDAPLITPLLAHDDKRVRQAAARALERIYNPEVIPDLTLAVDAGDRTFVRVIAVTTEVDAAAARRRLTSQPGKVTSEWFAQVAGEVSRDASASRGGQIPPYTAGNPSLPTPLRMAIARTTEGQLTPTVSADKMFYIALVEKRAAGEVDRDTREAAACALGQYADPRALNALITALNDDELSVSRRARQSLRILTGHDSGEEPKGWQTWVAAQSNPFVGQARYMYPNFYRDNYWWEYIPFIPGPLNEPSSTPIGYRPPGG